MTLESTELSLSDVREGMRHSNSRTELAQLCVEVEIGYFSEPVVRIFVSSQTVHMDSACI